MWCKQCQQDVPARNSGDDAALRCPRCEQLLRIQPADDTATSAKSTADSASDTAQPPICDSWELDQQLREIGRTLGVGEFQPKATPKFQPVRLDAAHMPPSGPGHHATAPPWHIPVAQEHRRRRTGRKPARRASTSGTFTWIAVSLGTMALVCGGVLLGWSIAAERPELWNLGLPIALGGQIGLLVGLLLQLDNLWNDNRRSAAQLADVDKKLRDLKSTTAMLGNTHGSPGTAFYAHLAGGASPHLLLTDLKSQLDLLAMKLAEEE